MRVEISEALLAALQRHNFLPGYNAAAPAFGRYGWLTTGCVLDLEDLPGLALEENTGLYGGAYKPLPGGKKYSGLASIGAFSYSYSALPEPLRVGRYGSISSGLRVLDSLHPTDAVTSSAITFKPRNKLFARYQTPEQQAFAAAFDNRGGKPYPVIGHDVWIGANVALSMGITIGNGAIIGYGSVVTKDVPPYAVVVGTPAVVKRLRFAPELAERLLASRWWELDPAFILRHEFAEPAKLVARIERDRASIEAFAPRCFDFSPYLAETAVA